MAALLLAAAELVLLMALAPGVVGYTRWVKARLQGRRGAGVLQPYRELRKTFGKSMVIADSASWIFHLAPWVVTASTVAAAALVPVVSVHQPADQLGDLFALMALLILGTVFLALGGLDPGTAFGGMGSSREMTVAALTEPTLAIAVLALALTSGSTSLGAIAGTVLANPANAIGPGHALAFAAFLIAMLAETGRLPIDNPATHLELTMIHEAMILEYSGPYLALLEWAAATKLTLLLVLAANMFAPWGIATAIEPGAVARSVGVILAKLLVLATLLAVLETRVAKLRLFRVPELLAVSFTLALLAATSSFFSR
ncbi:MAG: formate hydrogenlyase [Acidobacteria bacterium RIFCSPLOWO2_12_FULL_67_14]|nr:MAG: formate hydrogenlyase [Acidobacteria bacterium RIFCSPLOWO2_02_FULL_67_21]OFW38485.1 MAG: formate hydrogenlyase [Acidobacteria bacterium RIFCSPLOWO2_12_FULL_67_14]